MGRPFHVLQPAIRTRLDSTCAGSAISPAHPIGAIAGIVEKAAGMKLDEYVQREIFAPLCIPTRFWYKDKAGNPHAMAGVELTPMDLAKLGQLMLNDGSGTAVVC